MWEHYDLYYACMTTCLLKANCFNDQSIRMWNFHNRSFSVKYMVMFLNTVIVPRPNCSIDLCVAVGNETKQLIHLLRDIWKAVLKEKATFKSLNYPSQKLPNLKWFYKVHIFWAGHKILRNLPLTFDYSAYSH